MLNALLSRPRRLLATLALLLAATGVAIGSGASFTSSSATAANTFASGSLTHSNDKDAKVLLSAANMKPGDTTTGTVTIKNTGSLAGGFTVAKSNYTDGFVTKLDLKITEGTTEVFSGKLSDFTSKDLGVYAAGQEHTYKFTVGFPRTDADQNTDQNKSASAAFTWTETQTAGRDLTADPAGATNRAD